MKRMPLSNKTIGWVFSYLLSILAIFGPIALVVYSIYLFGFWATIFFGICLFFFGFVALFAIAGVAQLAELIHHKFFKRM